MVILEENFKWHLEAFASELFICSIKIGKTWIRLAWWIRCYLTSPLTTKPSLQSVFEAMHADTSKNVNILVLPQQVCLPT